MTPYKRFIQQMKDMGASKPYMSEKDFKEANGIVDDAEECLPPLVIVPKRDARTIQPTHENYVKVEQPKKIKVGRTPRIKMTDEERKEKQKIWRRKYLDSEKGREQRRKTNNEYAKRNREKISKKWIERYHEKKLENA